MIKSRQKLMLEINFMMNQTVRKPVNEQDYY